MVRLFDNVLVLCNSFEDGISKLKKVIQRCSERGVVLKFAKSWIGFQQVKFFGYKVTPGKYELDEDRKATIREAEMPKTRKSMQRFLGMAVFFNEFVPSFSDLTAKLYDMIAPGFVWDKKTWTEDYGVNSRMSRKRCVLHKRSIFRTTVWIGYYARMRQTMQWLIHSYSCE